MDERPNITSEEEKLAKEAVESVNPSEATLQKAYSEIMTDERVVMVDGVGELKLVLPSSQERMEADLRYAETYSRLLERGIKTNDEMLALLKRRGVWGDEQERRLEQLDKEIRQHVFLYGKAQTDERKLELRKRLAELRREQLALQTKRLQFLNNCAEKRADDERFAYLLHRCVLKADTGERLWPTLDDYLNDRRAYVIGEIMYHYLMLYVGVNPNLLEGLPEELVAPVETGE